MEAFSYYPFLLDSPILASIPFETHLSTRQVGETSNNSSSCFPYYYSPEAILEVSSGDTSAYESSISLATATKAPLVECQIPLSSAVIKPHDEKVPKQQGSMEKKRKNGDEARSSYGQSSLRTASTKESKSRKQRKPIGELKGKRGKKPKCDDWKAAKAGEEPPEGYIHVRSKRGQATDSHSLAERVRREKISERMKMLQGLVPGCDKVTGKALVLDEIVNYVQSLQNQIEFLSMKLASVNPMLYDFGVDLDNSVNPKAEQKKMKSIQQEVPLVNQTTHIHPPAFENARNNYQMMDPSVPLLLHCQGSTAFPQDGGSSMIQVGEQRQQFINQAEFNNI